MSQVSCKRHFGQCGSLGLFTADAAVNRQRLAGQAHGFGETPLRRSARHEFQGIRNVDVIGTVDATEHVDRLLRKVFGVSVFIPGYSDVGQCQKAAGNVGMVARVNAAQER